MENKRQFCTVRLSNKVINWLNICMNYDNERNRSLKKFNRSEYIEVLLKYTDKEDLSYIPNEVLRENKEEKYQIAMNEKIKRELMRLKGEKKLSYSLILACVIYNAYCIKEEVSYEVVIDEINQVDRGIIVGGCGAGKTYYGIKPLFEKNESVVLLSTKRDVLQFEFEEDNGHKIFVPSDNFGCFSSDESNDIMEYVEKTRPSLVLIDETFNIMGEYMKVLDFLSFLEERNIRIIFTTYPYVDDEIRKSFFISLYKKGYVTIPIKDSTCIDKVSIIDVLQLKTEC